MSAHVVDQGMVEMMKNTLRTFGFGCLLALLLGGVALAADEAAAPRADAVKTTVVTRVDRPGKRAYKVQVTVKGRIPGTDTPEPADVDVVYSLTLQHSYGRREGEGMLPLEISVRDAEITSSGERLTVSPSTFPKLTALLDRAWQINALYGLAGTTYEKSVPGINYGNMIMFFYLHSGDKPHSVGETWKATYKLPNYPETYDFTITLKSIEEIDGVKVATVSEEVTRESGDQSKMAATMKTAAVSSFSIADGRLVRSHVDCGLQFPKPANASSSRQDSGPYRANIKLDISLLK